MRSCGGQRLVGGARCATGKAGRQALAWLFALLAAAWLCPGSAAAQTLEAGQTSALGGSWSLRSDKARQDAVEARLRGAVDAFLPTVQFLAERPLSSRINYSPDIQRGIAYPDTTPHHQPKQYGVTFDLPLFDGFQRWNSLQSARSQVDAGRQLSLDARQQVLLDTATAHLGVIRDGRIIVHRETQLASLLRIQKVVQTQFALSDATVTDLALTTSRVEEARTALEQARTELGASRLEYVRLTGLTPGRLALPRPPADLPRTEAEIADIVRQFNPRLAAARLEAQAASQQAKAAEGALYPQVSLQLSHSRQDDITSTLKRVTDSTAKLQARVPIYQPGTIPKIAEAHAIARQRWSETEDGANLLVTSARIGFQRWQSAKAQVTMLAARVASLRATVRGYEIERDAGFRTLIDELNGRAEMAQAEIALATGEAERSRQGFALGALLNRLDPSAPVLPAQPVQRETSRQQVPQSGLMAAPPERFAAVARPGQAREARARETAPAVSQRREALAPTAVKPSAGAAPTRKTVAVTQLRREASESIAVKPTSDTTKTASPAPAHREASVPASVKSAASATPAGGVASPARRQGTATVSNWTTRPAL